MARVVWNGPQLHRACVLACANGLEAAGRVIHQFYYNMLGQSNRGGEQPAMPMQAPRMGTGQGRAAITSGLKNLRTYVLAMNPKGMYLLMLDVGTKPHTIAARGGKKLKIWFRPKPFRQPTMSEIKKYGLKLIGGKWYYFRKQVRHPGTTEAHGPGGGAVGPSPWVIPGFQRIQSTAAAAFKANAK